MQSVLPAFLSCNKLWARPFVRFLVVGAGNTVFGYSLYLVGLLLGGSYTIALAIATILGAVFNFFTTGRVVFRSNALNKIYWFIGVYATIFAVNLALLTWLVGRGVDKAYAQALLLPVVVILSYLLNKHIIFWRKS